MRILALDAALTGCSAALLIDDVVAGAAALPGGPGQTARLAVVAQSLLAAAPGRLDAVAATVGPGSFTGLRAALALAHGMAFGFACPCIGVSVAEALANAMPPLPGRALWVAIDSKRAGRVFLDIAGRLSVAAPDALPPCGGPVAAAGDAAPMVAAALAARGTDVLLADARRPRAADVARVAARRLAGALPALAAQPLYAEAPLARPMAA